MSMISELVNELRYWGYKEDATVSPFPSRRLFKRAANTIEELSAKLHASQMERSSQYYNGGWIPCSERLPENSKHKGAFCPRYIITTEYGVGEGWYNPDTGCWYGLLWFMDENYNERNISMQRGDIPKVVKNVRVLAWMPLPEHYKESEVGND